jgi:uncharacterized protein
MFEKYIIEQNSHWQGEMPNSGFPREITPNVLSLVEKRHIVALVGVRRAGKSTVLKQVINHLIEKKKVSAKNILFLNLESPFLDSFKDDSKNLQNIFEEYKILANPKGKIYIFLDEVQFFSNWQVFVKSLYEKGGVKFFVTGSNSQLLSAEMATLLSGRSIARKIFPFSFREVLEIRKIKIQDRMNLAENESKITRTFRQYLRSGGFPEVVIEKERKFKKELLVNYYRNILYQDIVPRFEVKKIKEIESLLLYLFSNIGQNYSYNSLAKFLSIQDKTAKEYIGFFEKSFLLFELANYQYSIKKQENYPKKIYAIDNGFIEVASFAFSENMGKFLENQVFIELMRRGKQVYYYREKKECDFVVKEKTKIVEVIQVCQKINQQNEKRELEGLLEAMVKFDLGKGLILTENQEEKVEKDGKKIEIMPIWKWLADVE